MIKGMTGFGQAQRQAGGGTFLLEIKSVNHKFLDIVFHLPPGFNIFERKIKNIIQKKIKRGRVTVAINFSLPPRQNIIVNKSLAKDYYNGLKILNKQLGLKDAISLNDIVGLSGVVEVQNAKVSSDMWPKINSALNEALYKFIEMRQQEGSSIQHDINSKLHNIQSLLSKIPERAKVIVNQRKKELSQDELPLFLKSADINEEITRLRYHVNSFQNKLKKQVASGKELDFISQELQREINTIGAKLPDVQITSNVIKIKDSLEKIREHLQNVE